LGLSFLICELGMLVALLQGTKSICVSVTFEVCLVCHQCSIHASLSCHFVLFCFDLLVCKIRTTFVKHLAGAWHIVGALEASLDE
jgi:hypothetical protein